MTSSLSSRSRFLVTNEPCAPDDLAPALGSCLIFAEMAGFSVELLEGESQGLGDDGNDDIVIVLIA